MRNTKGDPKKNGPRVHFKW